MSSVTPPCGTADDNKARKDLFKKRSASRLIAVQILHQGASGGMLRLPGDPLWQEILQELKEEGIQGDEAYLVKLLTVFKATALTHFDDLLGKSLESPWTLKRLESLLLSILRVGAADILCLKEADKRLVVGEYVALAYKFFDKMQVSLVHAVLSRLAEQKPDTDQ